MDIKEELKAAEAYLKQLEGMGADREDLNHAQNRVDLLKNAMAAPTPKKRRILGSK